LKYFGIVLLLLLILWEGCGGVPKFVLPYEFRTIEKKADFIKYYSTWVKGKKFFLDPGHGGKDRNNKGFRESSVEADINLNVALALRDLLVLAGGEVLLSRNKDTTVELKDRSLLANKSGANIFISIHHNAAGEKEDIWTNYTSTYYHANENDYEYEPCQRDLARYIQRDLSYSMRNSGGTSSFDGTYSDYNIYPGQGFSVLRLTKIPAVLVECGFTTSEYESDLITIKEFNNVEAWGIFRGLCRYFKNGIPEIKYINTKDTVTKDSLNISFSLQDSSGINLNTLSVFVDALNYRNYNLNGKGGLLIIQIPSLHTGNHTIRIIAANKNGNYAFPFYYSIFIPNNMDK
jgi:N-acetylmuramoyl-L-alanine amidase